MKLSRIRKLLKSGKYPSDGADALRKSGVETYIFSVHYGRCVGSTGGPSFDTRTQPVHYVMFYRQSSVAVGGMIKYDGKDWRVMVNMSGGGGHLFVAVNNDDIEKG